MVKDGTSKTARVSENEHEHDIENKNYDASSRASEMDIVCDMDGGSSMSESNEAETMDGFQPRTSE